MDYTATYIDESDSIFKLSLLSQRLIWTFITNLYCSYMLLSAIFMSLRMGGSPRGDMRQGILLLLSAHHTCVKL